MKKAKQTRGKMLFRASSALAGLAAMTAMAQTSALAQEATEEDEEIVVTGTRIAQPDFEFSNPIASADAETIERSGITNVTEFAQDMPALLNSFDSQDSADTENSGTQGLNLLDLRGLGTSRTLVLVDGRRHVAGDEGSAAVDINTIPVGLIERVEVLTGGASAIYGADGVTGVVNFIMKDDYEGLQLRSQFGTSDLGGGDDLFASMLGGMNFANGRGNITAALEISRTDELNSSQRDFTRSGSREVIVEDPAGAPYTFGFFRDVRYFDTSPQGSVYTVFDGNSGSDVDYLGDGSPWVDGIPAGTFTMIGGSGSLLDSYVDQLLPGLDRNTLDIRAHYDITNSMRLFGEVKWAHTETQFEGQVTYDFFMAMQLDNPYMPANILNDALQPGHLGDTDGLVFMARDNFDLGSTYHDIERDTYRTVLGLDGDITSNIRYELSWTWGQTQTDQTYHTRNNERWFAAIDVVDNGSGPECRSNDGVSTPLDWGLPNFFITFNPGECIPANIYGNGVMSEAARNWIMVDLHNTITISQTVFNGYISGDTSDWFELPAGPIGFAFGGEYRREESEFDADPLGELAFAQESVGGVPTGDWEAYDLIWNGNIRDSRGHYNVSEVFVETEVPILRDQPFADELLFDAAFRFSDYSTVGETETWKYGLRWRPTEWLMFRGTQARAVRAPNISELFAPLQQTFAELDDPCDSTEVGTGSSFRYANCLAALTNLGLADPDPNHFVNTTSTSIPGDYSGNEDLDAETADTITYGFVVEPTFLPGLSISVDYWDIELQDAIEFLPAQTIVDYCYDLPQPNDYCALVERTAGGIPALSVPAGGISSFTQISRNISQYVASGYDIGVRYNLDPADWGVHNDIGRFQFALNATKLEEYSFRESDLVPPDDQVGQSGGISSSGNNLPEWQATLDATWLYGPWTVNYGFSWFSKLRRFSEGEIADDPNIIDPRYFYYEERAVHDIYAAYDFGQRVRLYAGINNFTNQLPDRGAEATPVGPLGRFFYVGARLEF